MSDFCTECGLPVPSNATACKNGHQYHRNAVPGTKVQPPAGMPPIFPPPVRQPPTTPPTGMPVTPSRLPKTAATNPSQTFGAMIRQYPGTKQPKRFDIGFRMKCPFCNFEFHPNDCAVYSTVRSNQNGEKLLLRQAPVFHTLARLRRIPLEGPLFTQNAACRQCPRCENFLPYRFELDASFNIAMVGDAFSGKSHYLAALLHQLMSNEIAQQENIRVRLSPMNDLAKSKWKEFQETLFERHGLLPGNIRFNPATEKEIQGNYSIREPLIFRLEIGYLAESVSSVINLVFYDMSGEDIADENVMALYGWPKIGRAHV